MTLLALVHDVLERRTIAHALIGAAALAVHGVVRSTVDIDLLAVDPACLEPTLWDDLRRSGVGVDIRHGDGDDPLAGVVRLTAERSRDVDLLVGRDRWQLAAIGRARSIQVFGAELPVVSAADLTLLKLFAGGPQDSWDVQQLLAADSGASLVDAVERLLPDLPERSRQIWRALTGR